LKKAEKSMGGRWVYPAVAMELNLPRFPVGFAVADSESTVIHAVIRGRFFDPTKARSEQASGSASSSRRGEGRREEGRKAAPEEYLPICRRKKGDTESGFRREPHAANTVKEALAYSSQFCKNCKPLLIVSLQMQVNRLCSWLHRP
jgi:hypothetical protein